MSSSPSSSSSQPPNRRHRPTNHFVNALLTDTYQITMTYAHWKIDKHNDTSTFELFFRKNPFPGGQYTIFCGLSECLKHLQTFEFTDDDIQYLKNDVPSLQHCESEFFDEYLSKTLRSQRQQLLSVYAPPEGTIVFPKIPLLIVNGPLGLCQLLETTFLNLINYPSLISTNASRMVNKACGCPCIEFGLRRAQGPDGGMSASLYSYIGGFDATSNVLAGKTYGIPIAGTHAHSYVQSFSNLCEVTEINEEGLKLYNKMTQQVEHFVPVVLQHLHYHMQKLHPEGDGGAATTPDSQSSSSSSTTKITTTNMGELAAFCAYACAFPDSCLCLIDTYDTLRSGLINFIAVALALIDFGYQPKGVRLDSGDLASLSRSCRQAFDAFVVNDDDDLQSTSFRDMTIIASNDINEKSLVELKEAGHAITAFGIGTNLVTCQAQPALGCVYKLVVCNGSPRIKLSQEFGKMTLPGQKRVYRLYGLSPNHRTTKNKKRKSIESDGDGKDDDNKNEDKYVPLVDYMTLAHEEPPKVVTMTTNDDADEEEGVLCRHPFNTQHRLLVKPAKVECIHDVVFANGQVQTDQLQVPFKKTRAYVQNQLLRFPFTKTTGTSTTISSLSSPSAEYNVMVSIELYKSLHELWEREAPVEELS